MPTQVSVLIPVHNAAGYLRSALMSMQHQTLQDIEIVTVDDGSSDSSLTILREMAAADTRIKILSRPNTGIVGALNDGLAIATGEYIARMDADDLSHPLRLERQVSFLQSTPEVVAVGCAFHYIDSKGYFLNRNPRLTSHELIEKCLLAGDGGSLIHPAVMIRAEALRRVGGYRQEAIWIEDLDLYLRLARIGRLANLPESLFWYRQHESSVNFTRNAGRLERKLKVLAEAWQARGLSFDDSKIDQTPFSNAFSAEDCRRNAASSLAYGKRGRPWHWMLRALRMAPRDRQTWRTLSYLTKAKLGLISISLSVPETDL